MLGVNVNGNNWKLILVNFAITYGAQLVYGLIELLPKGTYPSVWELYKMGLISLGTTITFYGLNKITHSEGS